MGIPERLEVEQHSRFKRDLKKLSKKYNSLPDDLKMFLDVLLFAHGDPDTELKAMGIFPLSGKSIDSEDCFIAKKFACKSLKGSGARSGIRVVYRIDPSCVHLLYIEIFHKKEKPLPDLDRIRSILKVQLLPEEIDPE